MELLDTAQLIDACQDWAGRKDVSMSDVLVERSWLTAAQHESVRVALEDRLARRDGDVRAALGATADVEVRDSIRIVQDAEVLATLNERARRGGSNVLLLTALCHRGRSDAV